MPTYIVSYDITRPGQKYDELWNALKALDGKRILMSQWAVHATGPAPALRDVLWGHMDATDRLLVQDRDSEDWASNRLMIKLGEF